MPPSTEHPAPHSSERPGSFPAMGGDPLRYTNPSDQDIVGWLPQRLPDARLSYGTDPLQFGDLRIPQGPVPDDGHPVVVVLHGGGYSPNWNLDNISRLAESLTVAGGVATWNLEYRRPGQTGGGWPGTWLDIAKGIDQLRTVAEQYPLNLVRTIAVGHSAGATFAAWAAARASIPESSELYVPDPLELQGIVSLSGILDLNREIGDRAEPPRHLKGLLTAADSDTRSELRAHLAEVSPLGIVHNIVASQRLIVGSRDADVMIEQTREYAEAIQRGRTTASGYDCLDGANHFDVIDPCSAAWPVVADAAFSLLGLSIPAGSLRGPSYCVEVV